MKEKRLQIGISDGTNYYHTEINGQLVAVRSFSGLALNEPLTFVLHEEIIPGKTQRETLKNTRCHFFLQVLGDLKLTLLAIADLIPGGPSPDQKLFLGGAGRGGPKRPSLQMRWHGEQPPSTTELLKGIRTLLESMEYWEFARWQSRMKFLGKGRHFVRLLRYFWESDPRVMYLKGKCYGRKMSHLERQVLTLWNSLENGRQKANVLEKLRALHGEQN